MKRCEIDRLTVVKSWKNRGNVYLGWITSYAWLWKVKICTLIIDRDYIRRRYKVRSNEYGRRRKAKVQKTKWAIDLRFKKIYIYENKLKTEKIYIPNEWLLKKKEKEKKEPENVVGKRKKKMKIKQKKNEGQYGHILFFIQWLLSLGLTHVSCIILLKLYWWKYCCSVRHEEERHNSLRK